MIQVLTIIAGTCVIIALLLYHARRLHLYKEAAKIPGPSNLLPIVGNALSFIGNTDDLLNKIQDLLNSYPSPCRVWLGNRLYIGVCEPDQIKTILHSQKTIDKDYAYKFMRPWIGTGLLSGSGPKWRLHRKLIGPTFNIKILESFVTIFAEQSEIMTTEMRKELKTGQFDILPYVSLCTLDIICESAMGVKLKAQTGNNCRFVEAGNKVAAGAFQRMAKVWLQPDFIFNLTKLGRIQHECLKYLHGITENIIHMKKRNIAKESENEIEHDQTGTKQLAFLDLLMTLSSDNKKFTDEELRDEISTMTIAGNDTTATINSFALLMLANHPEIQARVYRELCDIYGDEVTSDTPVKTEDLNRMEYLERVIKETMRIFPTGPILARSVTEDLDIGEYTLPKGSSVVLGVLKMHRSERYWTDPLKFDPDRFLPEEIAKRHPYCYVPFSAGPRSCIGYKYAMMAMKVLLATVLRRYVLKRDTVLNIEDVKLKIETTLKAADPLLISISERRFDTNINKNIT